MRRARKPVVPVLVLAFAFAFAGCGSSLKLDWLPDAAQLDRWPYGGAVAIAPQSGGKAMTGELIAVGADSVYVLGTGGLETFARADVKMIETRADWYGANEYRLNIPGKKPEQIAKGWARVETYARYPGGLPDSLDRTALRLPPARKRTGAGTFLNP